eukprot:1460543-Pyramimonas_sp.AAC.1
MEVEDMGSTGPGTRPWAPRCLAHFHKLSVRAGPTQHQCISLLLVVARSSSRRRRFGGAGLSHELIIVSFTSRGKSLVLRKYGPASEGGRHANAAAAIGASGGAYGAVKRVMGVPK